MAHATHATGSGSFRQSQFVAEALLAEMRSGNIPSHEEAAALDVRPLIDRMREQVTEADRAWLVDLVEKPSEPVAGLAVSLLRHQMDDDLLALYCRRWEGSSAYLKNRLMWRMLDRVDLGKEWQERFFAFVREDWEVFRDFNLSFYGGADDALTSILDRIGDPSFPATKKWIYACSIPEVIPYGGAARGLLALVRLVGDSFASTVVDYLEKRFLCGEGGMPGWAVPARTPEPKTPAFLAEAVLNRMRGGHRPDEETSDWLNRLPIVDSLRERVREQDTPWVLGLVDESRRELAGLCLSLLKKYDLRDDIRENLRSRWTSSSPFLRAHLMWRILDDPDLPQEWHRRIFDFVLADWATFHAVSLKFLGQPETVVFSVLARMKHPDHPQTKHWAYLCRVVDAGADPDAVEGLLRVVARHGDNPFTVEVAQRLLRKFYT